MEIIFLRGHIAHKIGDHVLVPDEMGAYLIRCGVAELKSVTAPTKPRPSRAKPKPAPVASVVETKKGDEEFDL
jgi:hypothetical protein